jgi:hypothetical protein
MDLKEMGCSLNSIGSGEQQTPPPLCIHFMSFMQTMHKKLPYKIYPYHENVYAGMVSTKK